jgi:hypothetical protein
MINMVWVHVLWLLLAAGNLRPVLGQSIPKSPCPKIFWYEMDASGTWHGHLNIPAPPAGSPLRTVVELDTDAVLPTVSLNYLNYMKQVFNLNYI